MDGAAMTVLTGAATITMEDAELEHTSDIEEIKGQNGECETIISSNPTRTCTINFAPNGETRAAAIVSSTNAQPAQITKVVLSGFAVTAYNGDWNSLGYTIRVTKAGEVTMSVRLKAFMTNRASLTNGLIAT
jgi:hypothetical protein